MTIIQLIALLPIIILMSGVILIMLIIAWRRIHCLTAILSIISLLLAFLALFIVNQFIPVNASMLFFLNKHSIVNISMLLFSGVFACIFGYFWLSNFKFNQEEFYLLILFTIIGSILLSIANHMVTVFISLELICVPMIGLIRYSYSEEGSLNAVIKYLISSALGTTLILLGMALIYLSIGDLSFLRIKYFLNTVLFSKDIIFLCGLAIILFSFALKLSIVPFHIWIFEIYRDTPSIVLIFLSTTVKIAMFSLLMNFCFHTTLINVQFFIVIVEYMTFLSMIIGNIMAIFQKDVKGIIGLSSIGHIGYLLITIFGIHSYFLTIKTSTLYLIGYLINNICIFGCIHLVSNMFVGIDRNNLLVYKGLFWKRPVLAISMLINLLSLIGFPGTIGFIGKFYLLILSIKEHLWLLTIGLLIGSIISVYFYFKIIINMFLKKDSVLKNNVKVNVNTCCIRYIFCELLILILSSCVIIIGCYPNFFSLFLQYYNY
ncbi:NADH-quinone oxidoreductase subunit N [Buchnera aphidicola]|nr:NADH-quinone oxidoreductase subunit N [Buchnera aphidicola]